MPNNITALSRQSADDLKITFEKDGEAVTVYLSAGQKTHAELVALGGDYISCALCCSQKSGFAACMTRCLYDGQCCDGGLRNCNGV